jgi:hypothetical protein
MSYTKQTDPIPGIADALAQALKQSAITDPVVDDLLAAGSAVQLETGDKVWVSSVIHDKPETLQVDVITVAIACRPDVTPWYKPNGQVVCTVFWHGVWAQELANLTTNTVRKALMMVALGEPQPQVPIPNPDPLPAPQEQDALPGLSQAQLSIRQAITAATEITQPVEDVL